MLIATLIISQPGQATQEVDSSELVTSIGSALDNTICLDDAASVARYHAIIEQRDERYWLSDLGSRQGTKVNDEPVVLERALADGDHITLGGACVIEFYRRTTVAPQMADAAPTAGSARATSELSYATSSAVGTGVSAASTSVSHTATHAATTTAHSNANPTAVAAAPATPEAAADAGKLSPAMKVGVGIGAGVLLTGAAAALLFNPFAGGCQPTVRILTPLNGVSLRAATTIRVEAREQQCIKRISYQLDGDEVASAASAPYEAALDPQRLSRFPAGTHVLTAAVETTDGALARQPGDIYVALNAQSKGPGVPVPAELESRPPDPAYTSVAATDVQAMAERLASQITGKSGYVFEREMITRIQAQTAAFANVNAPERAARERRIVVKSFSDRGLKPLVGFVLALSRSKFDDAANSEGVGLWRVPASVAQGYLQPGETQAALTDPQRAAEVAAVYLKDLLGVFDTQNFDLAVACYGSTLEEAGALKQRLATTPASERRDFWLLVTRGLIKPEGAERVVKFYAAGIVGENPQRFGGASDRPLSALEF